MADETFYNTCVICGLPLPLTEVQFHHTDGSTHIDCALTQITVYQTHITGVGAGPVFRTLSEALSDISNNMGDDDVDGMSIVRRSMTEIEYIELPEFQGY